jgi:3-hydroxyisobutyrate dehydrogenase-like beta-hydroxyacid dehydrogenase
MTKIAFLGLGQMGEPMARRLLDHGHELTVWNRTRSKADDLAKAGARVADSPADAATGAELAITMLTDPEALEAVLFGPKGLAEGLQDGATVIDMSTVGPGPIKDAAERLPKGVTFLEAPVLGSTPAVEDGSLKVLAGGDEAAVDRWREVLEVFGPVTHIGPLGSGAAMKLVANSALGFAMTGLGEALSLADHLGVDQGTALDILSGGPLGVVIQRTRKQIEANDFPPRFKLALAAKDLALVQEAGTAAGAELRDNAAARSWFDDANRDGLGDLDYPAVIRYIRER